MQRDLTVTGKIGHRNVMALKDAILKIVNKRHKPSSMIESRFGRYDLVFKTDEEGRAILLFMGRKDPTGKIIGERYARRLKVDEDGKVIQDHWELKGKASL